MHYNLFFTKPLLSGVLLSSSFISLLSFVFVTELQIYGIIFSVFIISDLVAKFLTSGILFFTSVKLLLKTLVKINPLAFVILFSTKSNSPLPAKPDPLFNMS